ncbi:MAG: hypothetical protein IJ554_04020 [Paludibacteraceae bacterium]|nr:hypothetical protein [Paludibacteraceae bacterium]MBR1426208.1 hypothetical protein [Paludibacteraceae bacterium]
MKNYKLIPQITLWVLLLLGIIVTVMFYVGGSAGALEVAGDFLDIPRFTDLFLTWNYILVIGAILITLVFVCIGLVKLFKVNPKRAIAILCIFVTFIYIIPQICYLLASPEKVEIIGYEGTDNVGFMARMSEAVIYWVYFMVTATVGTLIWGIIHTKRLK